MRTTRFLKAFWRLAKPYWVSGERRTGLILLATVVGLTLLLVWVEVLFNRWNNDFYNTLQDRDQPEFYRQLGMFTVIAVLYIVSRVYRFYFEQMLEIEWRTWLTDRFLGEWLKDRAHYRLSLLEKGTDNPDQRIAEDLRLFVEDTLYLTLGLLSAVVTLVTFVSILWALSGPLVLWGVSVPGYMVWAALLYATLGTWIIHMVGRALIGLEFEKQRVEANYRFDLVRLRENAEGIALYRGEAAELAGLRRRFAAVIGNWWAVMKKQKQIGWTAAFYGQIAIIFPYVVVAPRFFSGEMKVGGIFQTASAFGQVQSSLSWFIDAYSRFAKWKATVDRLTSFAEALERMHDRSNSGVRDEGDSDALVLQDVRLELPAGRALLEGATLELAPKQDLLIVGATGSGKSTLFRAIAGIWPYWKGRIRLPRGARPMFLPQKPYLPVGSLKQAVSYPESTNHFSDSEVAEALASVGLPLLAEELAREENWAQLLSGGEQQRLAFARALLNRPDWLFLDEATSALPEDAQAALYGLLKERLPETTLVSIGHRATLAEFHAQRLAWREGALVPG